MIKTTEAFVNKANLIHNYLYDYSKFLYVNSEKKGIIICPIHGEFLQSSNKHLYGRGCAKCGGKIKFTLNQFIEKSIEVHGDKYDYSKFVYTEANTAGVIICPIHGEFLQCPSKHIRKRGCQKCGGTHVLTKEEYIRRASAVHNNYYDYSLVKYNTLSLGIEIICPIHKNFFQLASNHLQGKGCRLCGIKKLAGYTTSKGETQFLDFIDVKDRNVKINNFIVDGLKHDTIYEFLGDYWHGNPQKYEKHKINELAHKTFGELHDHTFDRFNELSKSNYKIKYIWELDWKKYLKRVDESPNILNYLNY